MEMHESLTIRVIVLFSRRGRLGIAATEKRSGTQREGSTMNRDAFMRVMQSAPHRLVPRSCLRTSGEMGDLERALLLGRAFAKTLALSLITITRQLVHG